MQQVSVEVVAGLTGFALALLTVTLEAANTNKTRMRRIFIGNLHTANAAIGEFIMHVPIQSVFI